MCIRDSFLLSGIERGNTVQRGFNGSCLFGEIDRLLEQTGGENSQQGKDIKKDYAYV